MKKDLFYFCISIVFLILIIILSIKIFTLKSEIESLVINGDSENNITEQFSAILSKSIILNNTTMINRDVLSLNNEPHRVKELFSVKDQIVVYLNIGVCLPCVERFLQNLESLCKELSINNITILMEIENARQIGIMVKKFPSFRELYFSQDYLFRSDLFVDKPCIFTINNSMSPKNTFVYDVYLNTPLNEWLRQFKENSSFSENIMK